MTDENKRWKRINAEVVWTSPWMSIEKRTYELPDGHVKNDYYHLNRPDYVLILASDNTNRILVEKQYRRGVEEFVYELPAGWIQEGESSLQAAKRELLEETGMVGEGEDVYELFAQPGFSSLKGFV